MKKYGRKVFFIPLKKGYLLYFEYVLQQNVAELVLVNTLPHLSAVLSYWAALCLGLHTERKDEPIHVGSSLSYIPQHHIIR